MKIFLMVFSMAAMFICGAAAVYYGDAWYFAEHTDTTLAAVYDAERQCEADTEEHCQLDSYFLPDSFFGKTKATDQNWL